MFIPDPDLDFLLIPDFGLRVKKAPDPPSATLIRIHLFFSMRIRIKYG
jgi:hypothetical protein